MDWMTEKLVEIEHILEERLDKARHLLEQRDAMLHERRALHNWETEGGTSE